MRYAHNRFSGIAKAIPRISAYSDSCRREGGAAAATPAPPSLLYGGLCHKVYYIHGDCGE